MVAFPDGELRPHAICAWARRLQSGVEEVRSLPGLPNSLEKT